MALDLGCDQLSNFFISAQNFCKQKSLAQKPPVKSEFYVSKMNKA